MKLCFSISYIPDLGHKIHLLIFLFFFLTNFYLYWKTFSYITGFVVPPIVEKDLNHIIFVNKMVFLKLMQVLP